MERRIPTIDEYINESRKFDDFDKIEAALYKITEPMKFEDTVKYLRKETKEYVELGVDYDENELVFDTNFGWEGHATFSGDVERNKPLPFPIKKCWRLSQEDRDARRTNESKESRENDIIDTIADIISARSFNDEEKRAGVLMIWETYKDAIKVDKETFLDTLSDFVTAKSLPKNKAEVMQLARNIWNSVKK